MAVDPGSVKWATIYDDEHPFAPNYLTSLLPTIGLDLAGSQRLARGGWLLKHAKGYDIAAARNDAAEEFLASDAEWLLFIDADMGWEPDALEMLFDAADPTERPIVGGLCFGFTPSEDGQAEASGPLRFPFPTLYDLWEGEDDIGFRIRWAYRPNAVQRVGATGAAMLLIHRGALEAIAARAQGKWFDRIKHPKAKTTWGEDLSFCVRAGLAGLPVHVHAGVRTSHLKPIYVSEAVFAASARAQPADEEIDVIVPVLQRPHHAEPFMRSLRASTGLACVLAVANHDDDEAADAWAAAGAQVLRCTPGRTTFAQKVNDGYRATARPWLMFVGSDVRFTAGWWDHALMTARAHNASVVGTNDLTNLEVRNGILATHPVMRRSYIDEQGASWDGPGVVAHEGYKHWWVDAEWSTAARWRGELVTAMGSVVEHLHPVSGKSLMDDVYRLGQRYKNLDRDLFERRLKRAKREQAAA